MSGSHNVNGSEDPCCLPCCCCCCTNNNVHDYEDTSGLFCCCWANKGDKEAKTEDGLSSPLLQNEDGTMHNEQSPDTSSPGPLRAVRPRNTSSINSWGPPGHSAAPVTSQPAPERAKTYGGAATPDPSTANLVNIEPNCPKIENGRTNVYTESFTVVYYQWVWYTIRHEQHFEITKGKGDCAIRQTPNGNFMEITIKATAISHGAAKEVVEQCRDEITKTLEWISSKDEYMSQPLDMVYAPTLATIECPPKTYICEDTNGNVVILAETEQDMNAVQERLMQRRMPSPEDTVTDKSGFQPGHHITDKPNNEPYENLMLSKPPAAKRTRKLAKETDQAGPSETPTTLPTATAKAGATYRHVYGQHIHVFKGDLTTLIVGVVVNASNQKLVHGGGIAGAVKKAAGPGLQEECTERIKQHGKLEISEVYTSAAYNMPCQSIIHVAGPRWKDYHDKRQAETLMYQSFLNCLLEAERLRQPSIALPAVGSGIYGSPLPVVAQQMYNAVQSFLDERRDNSHIRDILLVDISDTIVDLLHGIMAKEPAAGNVTVVAPNFQQFITAPTRTVAGAASPNPDSADTGPIHHSKTLNEGKGGAASHGEELLRRHTTSGADDADGADDVCCICLDQPTERVVLFKCGHVFCKECINTWFKDKPTCPTCGHFYGKMTGDMPEGTMTDRRIAETLPGYEDAIGAIVITYRFAGGIQQACHPNPGLRYRGTTRRGFLPDNEEGNEVLVLLRRAFNAKLTFTIGRSTTTGRENMITWNDIHHKTRIDGGPERFGYPDPTYLSRVKDELAAKGIK